MEYKNETIKNEVYVSERKTDKNIFRYEYKHSKGGWWITREYYNVNISFPEKIEIWIPDEVMDHITAFNAKDKLETKDKLNS